MLVVCLGNEDRQDDAIGPHLGKFLQQKNLPGIEVVIVRDDPTPLADALRDHPRIVILDAIPGEQPGRVHCVRAEDVKTRLPSTLSSHGINILDFIRTVAALEGSPKQIYILAIEGRHFGFGPLSPSLQARLPEIQSQVLHHLTTLQTP